MRMSTVFSKHLKAEDLGTTTPSVTIERVELEKVGEDTKPVMYFAGKDKGLVLNVTNANMVTEIAGTDESDAWSGQRIQLYVTKVDYAGKRVPAIRIRPVPSRTPVPPVVHAPADGDITDEEIPF